MDTWLWIVLVVIAIGILAAVVVGATRGRERRLEAKRGEANVLRDRAAVRGEQAHRGEQEAEAEAREAQRRQQLSEESAEEARREREAAQETAARADEVDPDVRS